MVFFMVGRKFDKIHLKGIGFQFYVNIKNKKINTESEIVCIHMKTESKEKRKEKKDTDRPNRENIWKN